MSRTYCPCRACQFHWPLCPDLGRHGRAQPRAGRNDRPHAARRRGVGDLLGVVLALSARTRRMVQEPVNIDIDVFAPGGKRALRMSFGKR
ncbi:hypothetical protein N8D56_15780 [Devosia sp. A8/3-2]|nr:hypothetical protein N8D56_15780 [Devosia sp. A8/3-2]